MSSIDNRIVNMQLKNTTFLGGIKRTLGALKDLKDGLKFPGSTKGFEDVEKAASRFSLQGIQDALDQVNSKFSWFGAVAGAILWRVTNEAMNAGSRIADALWSPIVDGGKKRALNLEQAKFQFEGLGMDVRQSMEDALYAVKDTAFGLDEAAVAASQFGASGIKSGEDMKSALRGISGVAAMSGASYSDMANVFTKVAGQGRLMGDDLNRLGTRGINAAATLAEYFNKTGLAANATEADIREMVTKGEIDFKTFSAAMSDAFGEHATKANETYTGSLSNMRAALARIGATVYTGRYEALRKVFNALTPVIDDVHSALKPLLRLMNRSDAAMSRGVVGFLENLDLTPLRVLLPHVVVGLTNIFRFLGNVLGTVRDAFLSVFPPITAKQASAIGAAFVNLTEHLKMGDGTLNLLKRTFAGFFAIVGIGWEILKQLVLTVASLFGFMLEGSGSVLEVTARFGDFLVALLETIRSGEGLSNFFDNVREKAKALLQVVKDLGGGLLTGLSDFFGGLDWGSFADGFGEFTDKLGKLGGRIRPLELLGKALRAVADMTVGNLDGLGDIVMNIGSAIFKGFKSVGSWLLDAFINADWNLILDAINTGLLAGIVLAVRNFLNVLTGDIEGADLGLGLIDTIKETFGGLTEALSAMTASIKVGTLVLIAGAVALLTGSLIALSNVDSLEMTRGLAGIASMMGLLVGAMYLLNGVKVTEGVIKMPIIAAGMVILAIAVNVLASAVERLSGLDWEELAKGLGGVVVILGAIVGVSKGLSGHAGGLITAGLGMIALSIGVRILASSVKTLGDVDWEDLAKGLLGVGGLLGSLLLFTRLAQLDKVGIFSGAGLILLAAGIKLLASAAGDFGERDWQSIGKGLVGVAGVLAIVGGFTAISGGAGGLLVTGAALIAIGGALKIFASALKDLGGMSWSEIGRGLTTLAGGLTALALAAAFMSGTITGALAMVVVAGALRVLTPALLDLSNLNWGELARGLTMLAGSLLILTAAMYAMSGALLGAAAMVVVASAIRILAPALVSLGELSWTELLIGLVALASALTLIGLAGLILTPVIPSLLGLGVAIGLIGLAVLAAGAGVTLFAIGLGLLGAALLTFVTAVVGSVGVILGAIPMLLEVIGATLTGILNIIIENTPLIVDAIKGLFLALIEAGYELLPPLVALIGVAIDEISALIFEKGPTVKAAFVFVLGLLLEAFNEMRPDIIQTGWDTLIAFLKGIEDHLQEVIDISADIVVKYIDGIADRLPDIIQSGWGLLIAFIEGIEKSAQDNAHRITEAGVGIGVGIAKGVISGLASQAEPVKAKASAIGTMAVSAMKWAIGMRSPARAFIEVGKGMDQGVVVGLERYSGAVKNASQGVGRNAIDAMRKSVSGVSDILDRELNLNPQITPTVDMTDVIKGSRDISKLLAAGAKTVAMTDRALEIGYALRDNLAANTPSSLDAEGREKIVYNQYNTSPKALDPVEIYRQTNNQLTILREGFSATSS